MGKKTLSVLGFIIPVATFALGMIGSWVAEEKQKEYIDESIDARFAAREIEEA